MKSLLLALSWLAVIATLIPLHSGDAWWIRGFDFPRVQIAVVAVVLLLLIVLVVDDLKFYDYLTITALFGSIGLQVWQIFPYTPFAPVQVQASTEHEPESTFYLLIANVLMDNRNVAGLKTQIQAVDPDTVLVVEVNRWWESQLQSLQTDYPYLVAHPLDNTYGMILYSRLPLIDPHVRFIVQDDVPSIHTRVRLRSGTEIELHCVHPRPPSPVHHDRSTERDAELILVGKEVENSNSPVLVTGDLNDVAWSRSTRLFQKVSGLLDPRVGRGIFGTFHARYPLMRWPLDHVFHSNHFTLIALKTLDYFGSDHLPVFIALNHEPAAQIDQDELDAPSQAERQEMRETVQKATKEQPRQ
nr:endonuclease/exonuclease/phosphatase family protein [Gammaproteobacteria bacterium]